MTHTHKDDNHHEHAPRKGLHQDWRAWVVVLLMLGAMAVYIFSDDESIQPGGGVQAPMAEDAE